MHDNEKIIQSLISSKKITGLSCFSKDIKPGYLFAAFNGYSKNGDEFINEAINFGAIAILKYGESGKSEIINGILFFYDENPRKFFAKICSIFFEKIPNHISAVTGTNGKTSVVNFANQIMWKLGIKSASIGTLGVIKEKFSPKESLTTPDTVTLYHELEELKKDGIDHVFIEASSQGLHQYRIDYLPIQTGLLTNLKSDHLDYHKTMFDYYQAKMRLFKEIVQRNIIVHNDYINTMMMQEIHDKNIIDYGENGKYINAKIIEKEGDFNKIMIKFLNNTFITKTKIIGTFQIENLLAAITLCYYQGADIEKIIDVIPEIEQIKGRLEKIASFNHADIIIDYAHNPDGMENLLKSLKQFNKSRLVTVFGCGGNRDKTKRSVMGEIAAKYSDLVIITDDNPRDESPEKIRKDILSGIKKEFLKHVLEIPGRYEAIKQALSILSPNDILVITGKGIEDYQIFQNNQKEHFNDEETVLKIIQELSQQRN